MDAQRGLSVSGHRNTVLCLHLTSDTYHVTPSGRAPRARGKFWIRRVKLRIFRPDPKSHKSEGFPAAQIFKTHKCQNTYCRSAHFSKAVKFVGAQNPRGTPWLTGAYSTAGEQGAPLSPGSGSMSSGVRTAKSPLVSASVRPGARTASVGKSGVRAGTERGACLVRLRCPDRSESGLRARAAILQRDCVEFAWRLQRG